MAVNQELEEVVLGELYDYVSTRVDPSLRIIADDDRETGKRIIEKLSETRIDELHKVRIHFSHFIGYGYDFTMNDIGTPAKEIYTRAVERTKQFNGNPHSERFVDDGIVNDRYGWYITSLK